MSCTLSVHFHQLALRLGASLAVLTDSPAIIKHQKECECYEIGQLWWTKIFFGTCLFLNIVLFNSYPYLRSNLDETTRSVYKENVRLNAALDFHLKEGQELKKVC